jgi:PBSX family phage terminase large subunit
VSATTPLGLPLSPAQLGSIRESTARVNVWDGSIRSGKTVVSLLRWLIYVASAPTGGQLVVIARTRDTAYRNVFAPLQDPGLFGEVAAHVQYTAGAPTAQILGRTVFVIGASDAKAEKVLRGLTVAGAYCDEVTVLPEEFFTQLLGRMSVPGAQLFGTTNPDNPAHWLKRKYLDRIADLPDWRRFHFTMKDNPALTPEYVASVSREFTGLWHRRFILGEWVAAEGAIYGMWDPALHVIPWGDLPPLHRLYGVGVDHGTTNASAGLLVGIGHDHDDNGRRTSSTLYLVDEWRHDPSASNGQRLTNADLSASFREWLALPHLPYRSALEPERVFLDPAAAGFQVQLAVDGVAGLMAAENSVSYGIGLVASLLGAGRLKVSSLCTGFATEAPGYSWDPKATEKGEDKPIKVADHSLDAGRYAVATTESLWRPLIGLAA